MNLVWDGAWVADRIGVQLDGAGARDAVGLALRRNARRVHLLVSHQLGKHIPADPRTVYGAGLRLGELVEPLLGGSAPLVLGYAETATGLGHAVADRLDADCLHSTRRVVPGVRAAGGFTEEHSHATRHLLLPTDPALLAGPRPLVLVDDELSTGRTAANTIRELHAIHPRELYVVAALVDVRGGQDALAAIARELSVRVAVVAGCTGTISLPPDVDERAAGALACHETGAALEPRATVSVLRGAWLCAVRDGGRHGFGAEDRRQAARAAREVADRLAQRVRGERVLVLGCEELMYAPTLIAVALADAAPTGQRVLFSSTTRSPVVAVDEPGYAVRTALAFPAHDGPVGTRYAYNVAPAADAAPYTDIVLVIDDVADTPALHAGGGLLAQLAAVCERLHVVVLPGYRPR